MGKSAASTLSSSLGRRLFGVASLATGLIILVSRGYNDWHQFRYLACAAAVAQIIGGVAIQFRARLAAKTGAAILSAAYLVFALLCVPAIVAAPRIYNSWGNFFEQFSLFTGAALAYACLSSSRTPQTIQIGRILLGICTVSFALEQAFYLAPTAHLVPKWLPPSQMFWAVTTTVFFALAALALLANQITLLAARLLTLMILLFGLLVWLPLLVSAPRNPTNWSETAETFAIAAALWILADLLGDSRLNDHSSSSRR